MSFPQQYSAPRDRDYTLSSKGDKLFREILPIFQRDREPHWRSEKVASNFYVYRRLWAPLFDLPIREITPDDIKELFHSTARYAPDTRNTIRSWLGAVFNWCIDNRYLEHNPMRVGSARNAPWPKLRKNGERRCNRPFSPQEIQRLTENLSPRWSGSVWKYAWLSCYLGLRKSTIYALRWRHVVIMGEEWWLEIPGEIIKQRKPQEMLLIPEVQAILGKPGRPDELLIPGLPHKNNVNEILKDAAPQAGLDPDDVFPHQFRASWCLWMRERGVDRETAQAIQGWSSDNVLLNHYWPKVTRKQHIDAMMSLSVKGRKECSQ